MYKTYIHTYKFMLVIFILLFMLVVFILLYVYKFFEQIFNSLYSSIKVTHPSLHRQVLVVLFK